MVHGRFVVLLALIFFGALSARCAGAGRVRLELVGDARGSAMAFQQWLRVLTEAGIKNVRIRSGRVAGKVGIQIGGTEAAPEYVVTGVVKSQDELVLPAGRYRRRDVSRLAQWLEDLAEHGPRQGVPEERAFGLEAELFAQVHKDLASRVEFSTKGKQRSEVVDKIRRELSVPLRIDQSAVQSLQTDRTDEELSGLSCGTVLAYVLRPTGLCVVPRQLDRGLEYAVVLSRPGLEIWPVGWEPDRPDRDVVPAMFELHNINVQGVSAATALREMAKRLRLRVLIDENALVRHGVEPAKTAVYHPRKRTTYGIALRKILAQARLKGEVRVDEAGKPFLWVTTVKPM
jgi:hypothetical protein